VHIYKSNLRCGLLT